MKLYNLARSFCLEVKYIVYFEAQILRMKVDKKHANTPNGMYGGDYINKKETLWIMLCDHVGGEEFPRWSDAITVWQRERARKL